MTRTLKIAEGVEFPLDIVTEKLAWFGRTGQGKTYGAMRMAELMLDAGAQIIVVDFAGPWFGLRSPARGPAYDIPILGGKYGDMPIDPKSGARVANLIIDRDLSIVLDVSDMTGRNQVRFCTAFAEQLFEARKVKQAACHVFIEECQEAVPQNPESHEAAMLGHWQRIWKIGRNYGFGGSLISQRPQEVNKKALNMSGTLFMFQLLGSLERKAAHDWMKSADLPANDIVNELPTLKQGCPRIWSAAFAEAFTSIARITEKRTADCSRTPKVGEPPPVYKIAPFDITEIREALQADGVDVDDDSAEGDGAEVIKALRKQVKELQAKLASGGPTKTERVEVPMISTAQANELLSAASQLQASASAVVTAAEAIRASVTQGTVTRTAVTSKAKSKASSDRAPIVTAPVDVAETSAGRPKGAMRRMLTALAQRNGLTDNQICIRAGISASSSTLSVVLSQARKAGWVEYEGEQRKLTAAGRVALGAYDKLPTGAALRDHWLNELGRTSAAGRALSAIAAAYPGSITTDQLCKRANISATSSTPSVVLSQLRRLELITGPGTALTASKELFDA